MTKVEKKFQVGDLVSRTSHGRDVLFRIEQIYQQGSRQIALLKGVDLYEASAVILIFLAANLTVYRKGGENR